MTRAVLLTEDVAIKLIPIDIERDAANGVAWLQGVAGRDTLRRMGVTDEYNHESTLELERQRLQKILDDPNELAWMIELDGVIVGIIEVHLDQFEQLTGPNVSIMIGDPTARGRGVGTTALQAVLQYLEAERALRTVFSRHLIDNIESAALLQKVGFTDDGPVYDDADDLKWQNVCRTVPEYFDVVDREDRATGELITKKEAHATGALHRLVAVYVFDAAGKLYLQEHKSGYLDHSVGGHVTAGEDYATAARREANEELGLEGQELTEVFTGLYSDELFDAEAQGDHQMHYFAIYECHPDKNWKFTPNEEVKSIIAEELETVVRMLRETPGKFTPGIVNTMAKFLEVKDLPYEYSLSEIRKNWAITR